MRQYEIGDRVCVDMAQARPVARSAGDQPTAPVLSTVERQAEGWLPGVIRGGTPDGLYEVELAGEAVVVASPHLRPRAEDDRWMGED